MIACVSYLVIANVLLYSPRLRNVVSGASMNFAVIVSSSTLAEDPPLLILVGAFSS
ncbi:MAG: hypothetical protein WBY94_02900 [Polyangiaceae bacterium]